jgi:hypothetical protein
MCNIIAVPLQQWLHERASVIRYTYIAFLVRDFLKVLYVQLTAVHLIVTRCSRLFNLMQALKCTTLIGFADQI